MNWYQCFYQGKTAQIEAASSYKAQQIYADLFLVPKKKQYMISVLLIHKEDIPVTHVAVD